MIISVDLTYEPRLTTNPLTELSRYYGHFILARGNAQSAFSYLKNHFNTTTPLIQLIFHGLKVVALTGFYCTFASLVSFFILRVIYLDLFSILFYICNEEVNPFPDYVYRRRCHVEYQSYLCYGDDDACVNYV